MIKLIFTIGNALLTIGSMLSLTRRAHHFSKTVHRHSKQPRYTKRG